MRSLSEYVKELETIKNVFPWGQGLAEMIMDLKETDSAIYLGNEILVRAFIEGTVKCFRVTPTVVVEITHAEFEDVEEYMIMMG